MEKRELECTLTATEVEALGNKILTAEDDCDRLEVLLKNTSANRRSELALRRAEVNRMRTARRTGVELRYIDVEERRDYRRGTVTFIRKDTGETVEKRDLTAEERQIEAPFQRASKEA